MSAHCTFLYSRLVDKRVKEQGIFSYYLKTSHLVRARIKFGVLPADRELKKFLKNYLGLVRKWYVNVYKTFLGSHWIPYNLWKNVKWTRDLLEKYLLHILRIAEKVLLPASV